MQLVIYDHAKHQDLLPAFGAIHVACMEYDHFTANILTCDAARATALYRGYAEETLIGRRIILFGMAPVDEGGHPEVVAFVTLEKPPSETSACRADVQKLLVSPRYRRKGAARTLLSKIEQMAEEEGRTLLTLSTPAGTPAARVYPELGWISVGVVPQYEIEAGTHELKDEIFFYKMLPSHGKNVKLPEGNERPE